jgi:hypothetical protein
VGEAHIFINEDPMPTNISFFNSRAGYHKAVPVEITLQPGDVNTITFGVVGSSGMSHLDPLCGVTFVPSGR